MATHSFRFIYSTCKVNVLVIAEPICSKLNTWFSHKFVFCCVSIDAEGLPGSGSLYIISICHMLHIISNNTLQYKNICYMQAAVNPLTLPL